MDRFYLNLYRKDYTMSSFVGRKENLKNLLHFSIEKKAKNTAKFHITHQKMKSNTGLVLQFK